MAPGSDFWRAWGCPIKEAQVRMNRYDQGPSKPWFFMVCGAPGKGLHLRTGQRDLVGELGDLKPDLAGFGCW